MPRVCEGRHDFNYSVYIAANGLVSIHLAIVYACRSHFTSEVKGKSDEHSSASMVPDNSNPTAKSGQSFGREQSERGASQTPDAAPAGFEPRRGTR